MPNYGMFKARSQRSEGGGSREGFQGASRSKQRGAFVDGIWHCDCDPRLPAKSFKVKKEGPNKGRWFYTCQKTEDQRCGFFLWYAEAKKREEAAVLNNLRDEPRSTPNQVPSNPRSISPPPAYTPLAGNGTISRKRSREEDEFGDDDAFPWPLTGEEDDGQAERSAMPPPETPRKAQKMDAYSTPAKRRLPWISGETGGLPTPTTTGSRKVLFAPMSEPTTRDGLTPGNGGHAAPSPFTTPTPSRFKDTPSKDYNEDQLVTDTFKLLNERKVALEQETMESLERLLTMHSLKTQGIAKGRETSRLAIKAKEARIAELEHRVATLEAELETEKAIVQHLKWEMENEVG